MNPTRPSDRDQNTLDVVVAVPRLDRFLREQLPALGGATLRHWFAQRLVLLNGRAASKGAPLRAGDVVTHPGLEPEAFADPEAARTLRVLYEDRYLIAVDKPAGMPSHALRADERGSVVSALLARHPQLRGVGYRELESGLVHRLDTETSGVLLAALDAENWQALHAQHEAGQLLKTYVALCAGQLAAPAQLSGYLRADTRKVRVAAEPFARAKPIVTELVSSEPVGENAVWSLVRLQVRLAARHQLRAQLAALGHPIAADAVYGGTPLAGLARHFLHAESLTLTHPVTSAPLQLTAALPDELQAVLAALRGASSQLAHQR